jgi:hypothetical protein
MREITMRSRPTIAIAIAIAALTVQAALARVDVKVDFDKTFNFKTVKTWDWSPAGKGEVKMARTQDDDPEAMKKHAEPPIVETVTAEMARLKLQHAPSGPDVVVNYYLLLTTNQTTQSIGQFLPGSMSWGLPFIPQATQSLKVLNQGSLVIDLTAKGNVVWRGVAQAEIKIGSDIKAREAKLREAVRDVLKRYPPKQD